MEKTTLKKSLKVAVIILLCGLILANLFTIACTALGLRGQLRWLPCAFLEVESGSMEPEISAGDLVFVWETPYDELKTGDIISYHSGTGYITHKIIRAEGDQFVTKGSANKLEDEPIGRDLYYARVLFVIPAAGMLFGYLSDPVKAIFEILIIISLFYGFSAIQYIDRFFENRKEQKKRKHRAAVQQADGMQMEFPPAGNLQSCSKNADSIHADSTKNANAEGAKPRRAFRPVRLLSCITLASMLATSPCMTAAKYVAVSDEFFTVAASANYFTSNLLSTAGDHFSIKGWSGSDYNLVLETKNYQNTLLFNRDGIDTSYALYLEPVTGGEYKSAEYYSLSIVPNANAVLDTDSENFPYPVDADMHLDLDDMSLFNDAEYSGDDIPQLNDGCVVSVPFLISGDDENGSVQDFTISVSPSTDPSKALAAGDRISFRMYAFTNPRKGFYQVLEGTFTLEVASSGTFLSPPVMSMSTGSLLINYRILTNLISSSDSSSKTVLISWDADKVYLNEYEPTAFNLIYNTQGNSYIVEDTDGRGKLTMRLEAFSSVQLQFFRMTESTSVADNNISAAVLENDEIIEGSLAVLGGE